MKAKHSIWKSKLAKTMFLTTVVLVAALFLGSAASAALKAVGTGEKNVQTNNDISTLLGLPPGTLNTQPSEPTLSSQKASGRAPATWSTQQQPNFGGRGQFLADDVSTYYTITFDQDAVINNLAYNGIYFLSGMDSDTLGNFYAVSYSGGLYSVDKDTGIVTYITYCVPLNSLAFDTTSSIWYVSGYDTSYIDALMTIDITTGATTKIGNYGLTNIMISIMIDTYGNMVGYDVLFGGNSHLYDIDKSTGAVSNARDMGHNFCFAQEGKFDRTYNDNTLYLAAYDYGQGQSYLAICDAVTGAVTVLNLFSPMDEIDALAIPYTLVQNNDDVAVTKIKAPSSGTAGVITPEITIKNVGLNDEYFPTEVTISKKAYSNYLLEDFEGSFPPAGWTIQTIFGADWHTNDYYGDVNNMGTGICAEVSMPHEQNAPTLTLLTTPSMDLSAVPGAILDLDNYQYLYYYDMFLIDVSIDGGNSWNNIYKVSQSYVYGIVSHIQKDLSAYAGNSDVRLRFGYWSMISSDYAIWQIDNIKVRSFNWNLEYDQTVYSTLGTGQTENLTFPAWTPADLGLSENIDLEYRCTAQTFLAGDQSPQNDFKDKMFTLHYGYFHDVAITDIPSPVSGLAQTQPVQVSLKNNGQNAENVNVNVVIGKITNPETIFFEDFAAGVLPPGWGTDHPSNWYVQYSNYAGGAPPELIFNYYPNAVDTFRVYTGPIDTTAFSALQLSFKEDVNDYNGDYTLVVQTSTDGTNWNTVYTRAGGPYGPTTTTIGITGGSPTLQIGWALIGDSYNINYWYIDDVQIDSLPITTEYDYSASTFMNAGDATTVSLPDWTPADLPFSNINYVVTATATLQGFAQIGDSYGFEDYVPPVPPTPPTSIVTWPFEIWPDGWTQSGTGWSQYSYNPTGGTGYCAYLPYYSATDGMWLMSPAQDTTSVTQLTLQFKTYIDWFSDSDTNFWVYTRADSGDAWTDRTPWANPMTGNYGPATLSLDITDDIGTGTQVEFVFTGTAFDFDYWYIDDVIFGSGGSPGSPGYLPGWTETTIAGGTPQFYTVNTNAQYPYTPTSPRTGSYMEEYNSYNLPTGSMARLAYNTPFDFQAMGYAGYEMKFWMWWYGFGNDYLDVQASTDGFNWNTVAHFTDPYGGQSNMWNEMTVDLTGYTDEPQVYLAFLGYSAYGYNMFVDDISLLGAATFADGNPGDNVLAKMITLSFEHDVGIDQVLPPAKQQRADLLWDNGVHTTNALSSQLDTAYPFNSQVADDFMLATTQAITEVAFDGSFWGGSAINPIDLNVIFYADDGSGNQPTGAGMDDPTSTALFFEHHAAVMGTDNGDGTFNYHIILNAPFTAEANTKYWFVSQWAGNFPPQWGCDVSLSQQLHDCMQGFPLLGYSYWTDPGFGDVAFQLFGGTPPPQGTYPPGTYSVSGIIKNFGVTFTEANIPVEAKITHVDNNTVIYDQTGVFAGPLTPGQTATVSFPDFTLANLTAWEGKYKIEIMTALPGDDKPSNDKKSLTITMAIPDVLPPITDHTMTGTMGQNGWYVSNVVITLTATDPFPPINDPLPPSGVNHTYYKLTTGGTYAEYTAPVTVTADGIYDLYYYSVDKAGNIETAKGPFNFKIDKTAPVFSNVSATKSGAKWVLSATMSDPASGVARVEFYVDDQLAGNGTTTDHITWTFDYTGKGKMAQAIAYDNAGNSAMSTQFASLSLSLGESLSDMLSVQQNLQLK